MTSESCEFLFSLTLKFFVSALRAVQNGLEGISTRFHLHFFELVGVEAQKMVIMIDNDE
jgi:hypothetical protein